MNKVFLIGRLTRDPELRYTGSNIATTRFTLAVNRPFQSQNGEQGTDFINVVVWRKQAENVKKYCTKGSLVAVEGRIQTGSYEKILVNHKAKVLSSKELGQKELAYTIKGQKTGYYYLINVEANDAAINETKNIR